MNWNNTKIYLREWKIAKIKFNLLNFHNNVLFENLINFMTKGKEKLKNDNLLGI